MLPVIYQICCHPDCDKKRVINYTSKEERKQHFLHPAYNIEDFKSFLENDEAYSCFRQDGVIEELMQTLKAFFLNQLDSWMNNLKSMEQCDALQKAFIDAKKLNIKNLVQNEAFDTLVKMKHEETLKNSIAKQKFKIVNELMRLNDFLKKFQNQGDFIHHLLGNSLSLSQSEENSIIPQINQIPIEIPIGNKKSFKKELKGLQYLDVTALVHEIKSHQQLISFELYLQKSVISDFNYLSQSFDQFPMLKKIIINCDAVEPQITSIGLLARVIGKIERLEYLDLSFRQYCKTKHLQDISELGRQLINQSHLTCLHINLSQLSF